MGQLPDYFAQRMTALRDPTAFIEVMDRMLARQAKMETWEAAEANRQQLPASEHPSSDRDPVWATLPVDIRERLIAFVHGPPGVPAAVAYRFAQRLSARQLLLDDPVAARRAAVREHERDVEELRTELAKVGLPFVEELVPFLLRGLIRTRRARIAERWESPAPRHL